MNSPPKAELKQRAPLELKAARRVLQEAKGNLELKYLDAAISRGYYAIFHAARAAVYAQGSDPTTHRGTVSEFNRLLIKPGVVEADYQAILKSARDRRTVIDYESYESELLPTAELARDIVTKAERFVERMAAVVE